MTQDSTSKAIIEIFYKNEKIFDFDAKSPNIKNLVDLIVEKEYLTSDEYSCKTDLKDFDSVTFEDIIKTFVKDFNNSLKLEMESFESSLNKLETDSSPDDTSVS